MFFASQVLERGQRSLYAGGRLCDEVERDAERGGLCHTACIDLRVLPFDAVAVDLPDFVNRAQNKRPRSERGLSCF